MKTNTVSFTNIIPYKDMENSQSEIRVAKSSQVNVDIRSFLLFSKDYGAGCVAFQHGRTSENSHFPAVETVEKFIEPK